MICIYSYNSDCSPVVSLAGLGFVPKPHIALDTKLQIVLAHKWPIQESEKSSVLWNVLSK